jgi:hypothetical protein
MKSEEQTQCERDRAIHSGTRLRKREPERERKRERERQSKKEKDGER